jgi:hypothetical protein
MPTVASKSAEVEEEEEEDVEVVGKAEEGVKPGAWREGMVGEVPKGDPNDVDGEEEKGVEPEEKDVEEEKGVAKVGDEENGAAEKGEEEEEEGIGVEVEVEEEERGGRGVMPLATRSANSSELLITAHTVRTKLEPREMELMNAWVWEEVEEEEDEERWDGKRVGEVTRSTKRERDERPVEAMEENGRGEAAGAREEEEGSVGIAGTFAGRGRKVWNMRLRVVGVVKWFSASYNLLK